MSLRSYLAQPQPAKAASLLDLEPEAYPDGSESLSTDIDHVVMARERPAAIVLDSSFLHNKRDVHHAAAARAMAQLVAGQWGRALLLEYVFLEVVTVLQARRNHETAVAVGTTLLVTRHPGDSSGASQQFALLDELLGTLV